MFDVFFLQSLVVESKYIGCMSSELAFLLTMWLFDGFFYDFFPESFPFYCFVEFGL